MTGTNAEQTLNLETDAGWRAHIKSLPCLYEHLTTWSRQAYPDDALTCSLYRYYDGDGGLLYVGISSDFATRDKAHYVAGRWRARACYATVEVFRTVCSPKQPKNTRLKPNRRRGTSERGRGVPMRTKPPPYGGRLVATYRGGGGIAGLGL